MIRKEASNCVAVVIHRTQLEKHDDLERRLQKIVMQLMVDQFSDVKTSVIKTLIPIGAISSEFDQQSNLQFNFSSGLRSGVSRRLFSSASRDGGDEHNASFG